MAKKGKDAVRLSKRDGKSSSKIAEEEEEENGFFGRLFFPGTVDTSVSENTGDDYDSDFDESFGSATYFSDFSGDSESGESSAASSTGTSLIRFDRELRAKHRAACKSMTVSDSLDIF